ncbi:MAG: Type IV fimbrial assembly, ATPase PilB [uncultured Campylobacterales bacterium]|uniref:Type IV fimbrial assembly, ATPase PilB n=1 Tax=uncultured Campylobacterales bacterium TaxID=352960 RepID=A0A6S6SNH1_9BACT|nr:MAG: Type IV fimbrial assembly, ATPase PilB [uncultured Campylobacterales bacterium]
MEVSFDKIELAVCDYFEKNNFIDNQNSRKLKSLIANDETFNLTDYLISNDLLSEEDFIDRLVDMHVSNNYKFMTPDFTTHLRIGNSETFLKKFANKLKLDYFNLDSIDIDFSLSANFEIEQLRKLGILPVKATEMNIFVAFKRPRDFLAQEKVQRLFQKRILKVVIADLNQIDRFLNKVEMSAGMSELISEIRNELQIKSVENLQELSSILKLIDRIIKSAVISRASDIHIEPSEKNCHVRIRIDGVMSEIFIFSKDIYFPLTSRLKLLANLNIAERRKPQDGRFSYNTMDRKLDFRISTLPISTGESIVLRILDNSKVMLSLDQLNMNKSALTLLRKSISHPYGIVFITGPTGSGKTTSLYAILNEVKSIEKKIITVEDPIEYTMNNIQQTQVNESVGHSFAGALRSILRQDPDVIMIGESRDKETLQIAIRAALTGHLVFSTLHTNDSISAITRLTDMGIEPYYISGAIVAIQAQRLVRRLCVHCKRPAVIPSVVLEKIKDHIDDNPKFFEKVGCARCSGTGFLGRVMISEVLDIDASMQSLIARGASKVEITKQANENGFVSMFADGMSKASQGLTLIEEVYRVIK